MQTNSTRATPTERIVLALRDAIERDDPDTDPLRWGAGGPGVYLLKVDVTARLDGFAPAVMTTYRLSMHLISDAVPSDNNGEAILRAGRLMDSLRSRLSRDPTLGGEITEWTLEGELGMGEVQGFVAGFFDAVLTLTAYAG